MDSRTRSLRQSPQWDMRVPVDTVIEAANYAILRPGLVELVQREAQEVLRGVTISYRNGLRYAADFTIHKSLYHEKDWDLTRSWTRAELHLTQ